MNGSVTPKVISFLCPLGSGLPAISSSRWFCQKASARATAKITRQTTDAGGELVEVLDQAQLIFVGDRPDAARATRAIRQASGFFIGDDLDLVRFDPVGRRRIDRRRDGLRRADRFHVGIFDGVVVLCCRR